MHKIYDLGSPLQHQHQDSMYCWWKRRNLWGNSESKIVHCNSFTHVRTHACNSNSIYPRIKSTCSSTVCVYSFAIVIYLNVPGLSTEICALHACSNLCVEILFVYQNSFTNLLKSVRKSNINLKSRLKWTLCSKEIRFI